VIHEQQKHLIHEEDRADVVQERTAAPIYHCNKEAAPIVSDVGTFQATTTTTTTERLGTTNIGTTNLGTTSYGTTNVVTTGVPVTHTHNMAHTHEHKHLDKDLATGQVHTHTELSPGKKSFGQKVKEVFTGRHNEPATTTTFGK